VEAKSKFSKYAFMAPIGTRLRARSGQAILEYILLLAIIMGISGVMVSSVSSTRDKMWKKVLCEVSAACPDCKSTQSAKSSFPKAGVNCRN